jgi:triple functional domain protein
MGELFAANERKLLMYVNFCQNKDISQFILNEYISSYFDVSTIRFK